MQDYSQAEQLYKQAEEIYHKFSNRLGLARVWGNLGNIYRDQSQWKQAQTYYEAAIKQYYELNDQIGVNLMRDALELLKQKKSKLQTNVSI